MKASRKLAKVFTTPGFAIGGFIGADAPCTGNTIKYSGNE